MAGQRQALAARTDAEILEELGLPDPDTLARGDDFAAFMARAVPEHLRQRALRMLWRSDPVLACVDGLNDYNDDYLTGSHGSAPLATSYQVGKGLLAHVLDAARADETADDGLTPLDKTGNLAEDEAGNCAVTGAQAAGFEPEIGPAPDTATATESVPARRAPRSGRPRRMVFHFDGTGI